MALKPTTVSNVMVEWKTERGLRFMVKKMVYLVDYIDQTDEKGSTTVHNPIGLIE